MADPRRDYLVTTIADVVGGGKSGADAQAAIRKALAAGGGDGSAAKAVDRFLDADDTLVLSVTVTRAADSKEWVVSGTNDVAAGSGKRGDAKAAAPGAAGAAAVHAVHFLKKERGAVPADTVAQSVLVCTGVDSPLNSLYLFVHNIFMPQLREDEQLSQSLQKSLFDLDDGLHTALIRRGTGRLTGVSSAQSAAGTESDVSGIRSLSDELYFWTAEAKGGGHAAARANVFASALKKIAAKFDYGGEGAGAGAGAAGVRTMPYKDVVRLLEDAQDAFNDIYRDANVKQYPQERMANNFELVSGVILRYLRDRLLPDTFMYYPPTAAATATKDAKADGKASDAKDDKAGAAAAGGVEMSFLWFEKLAKVRQHVDSAASLCRRWMTTIKELQRDWRDRWQGPKHTDERLEILAKRLTSVRAVRDLQDELARLLSRDEQARFGGMDRLTLPFQQLDVLQCGPFSLPKWEAAFAEFNRAVTPIEQHAASLLKARIFAVTDRPALLIGEFRNFARLLLRPTVATALAAERETLAGTLLAYVEDQRTKFDTASGAITKNVSALRARGIAAGPPAGKNLSETLRGLVFAKQEESKLSQTTAVVSKVLAGVNGINAFDKSAADLLRSIQEFAKGLFDGWSSDMLEAVQDRKSGLMPEPGRELMKLDLSSGGELKVQFSERLVSLIREVRHISELGFAVPSEILKAIELGDKFYRYALKLKQVANFYNTMEEQILRSQLGMLENEARQFESVVRSQAPTFGNNPDACEPFVRRLAEAADALTTRNRKLRAVHLQVCNSVASLLDTSLYRQRDQWLESVAKINALFTKEAQVYSAGAVRAWKKHWEHQLYRVFEFQYRMCIESLNDATLEIPIELLFKNKRLQFKPSLEELRSKYYRSLKRFLDIPKSFRGFETGSKDAAAADAKRAKDAKSGSAQQPVGEIQALYMMLPERNADGVYNVYASAEQLFAQLQHIIRSHHHFVALGCVDIEEFTESRLVDVGDWKTNFKALKQRRKECERLQDAMTVGCFKVNLASFKATVEDHMRRLSDALLVSLRKSALADLRVVDEYLKVGTQRLQTRPRSVEEMSAAKKEAKAIGDQKNEMRRIRDRVGLKNELLREMTAGTIEALDLSGLKPRWETFNDLLTVFDEMLNEQRSTLVQDIERKIKDCKLAADKFRARWQGLRPRVEAGQLITRDAADKIVAGIDDRVHELKQLQDQAKDITNNAEQFELRPLPTFEVLDEVQREITSEQQSWALVGDYSTQLSAMTSEPWVEFRAHLGTLNEFLHAWTEKLKARPRDVVYDYLSNDMAQYRALKDVLKYVTGDVFEPEHWRILFGKLKFPSDVTLAKLTLGHFVAHQRALLDNQKELQALAARAQGEIAIRLAVNELKIWAEQTEFSLLEQKVNGKVVWLIKEWKELFTKVSDQQTVVSSLQDTPYFAPFADQCLQLQAKLVLLDEVLHALNGVQRKWVYLAPIFGRGALPSEQPRFKRIDADFRGIMDEIKTNPNVVNLASVQGLKDTVAGLLDQLDRCQKALNDFLEEKRSKFPRFYFIGDDDLLEILGQSQNPAVINNHLKKLFAGIHAVDFSADRKQIVAMKSSDKEVVALAAPVVITEDVEDWLDTLAKGMEKTLADSLLACCRDKAPDYDKYSSQILCLAEMIRFTANTEAAIRSPNADASLKRLLDELSAQLKALTSVDVSDDTLRQLKVQALVLDLIHNIEVVRLLIGNRVTAIDDWNWHKQLRYYLAADGAAASASKRGSGDAKQLVDAGSQRCVIKMCDATFKYTYEYQGNAPKLVHTPLTDKCYLVLTQGMHLGYGGNPYGPAGTGKTESVKALGQAFGRQVLVFNCDEGIDFQSMGRIFTGIVKSGAWGCFDEFNRLKEDQLSAVSQQIQVIQAALKKGDATCELLARPISVNPNAAIFVTLNPASKDYGGRSKLPHNLKQLFRSVAMSAPDFRLIAEVLLYAEGFQHARELGHKIVEIYALSLQLLSPQRHYDWGLRALKTVLHHSGQLIHAEKQAQKKLDIAAETKLLVGALRINTMSKLTYADSVRFNALIQDVFPGLVIEEIDYAKLEREIRAALRHFSLEQVDTQIKKILQLYEALHQRMGVVIVGPSGCGKSVMLQVLREAEKRMGKEIVQHVMNPKALHREKLLGHMDHDTRLWSDGVLTASARAVQASAPGVHSWIICDGDVDPEWIESLNSVLDDNHLLTMPNGERIKFGDNVNFIFESHDLQFASPATVSRMGMIFLSEEDVDVKSLVTSWVARQTPAANEQQPQAQAQAQATGASAGGAAAAKDKDGKEVKGAAAAPAPAPVSSAPVYDERKKIEDRKLREKLVQWLDDLFYRALTWVLDSNALVVPTTKVGIVQSALSHLVGAGHKGEFAAGLIRGMGANLELKARTTFAKEVFSWAAQRAPDSNFPLDCYWNGSTGSLQPYIHQDLGLVKADALSVHAPPLINTVGVQRNRAIIEPWLRNMQPFIVVGPEGCGKTLLLTNAFRAVKGASVATIHCSAQTDATHVMQRLSEACNTYSTNKGRVLRPKEGDRLILFLKDLNLPRPDKYATIQLIAFLQQLITYRGFYDENLDWLGIEKVHIVGSMNPATTVGRHQLSTRFTAIVNVMYMSYPDHDALHAVYSSYLKSVLAIGGAARADDRWKTDGNVRKLAASMVDIYEKIRAKFSVDDYRHYLFNPRDLTEWTFGLLRYELGPPLVPGGGVSTQSVQPLFEPWGYECYRLFCDRLVDRDAIRKFEAILTSTLRAEWKYELKLTDVYYSSLNSLTVAMAGAGADKKGDAKDGKAGKGGAAAGGSAGRGGGGGAMDAKGGDADASKTPSELGPTLERMTSSDFKERLADSLRRYEDEHKNLRMLLFPEILDHLAFEDRVLSRPGGSILLIGDSGVGRRSSIALLSYMHGLEFFSPNMTKNYGVKAFRTDLKDLMRATGVEARRIVLYIEDHQIVENAFLEDLNSLLAAGEVPGLFGGAQELDMMLTPLKEEFAAVQGASEQRRFRNLFEFFTSRVRQNLHVVLSMNSAHPQFALRCESNPAIYNRCTILWMSRWTSDGMKQVQNARLQPILSNPALRINPSAIQDAVLYIHNSCVPKGATPTKYVAFLDTYLALYKQQLDKETTAKKHLDAGLDKLAGAAKTVEVLTKEATVKKELVARKQKEADNALDVITDRMAKASESRKEADEFRARASDDEKKQGVKKKNIESELKEIQPLLDNARTAVGAIQKDNLTEIRALRMPPPAIRNVLAGVLMLMKQEDVTWQAMRNHLSKPMFKEEIINFDAKGIDKGTRAKVTQMVKENADSFDPANIMRVNRAAAPLAQWVTANLKYSAVLESIAPLMNELDKATGALVAARNRADQCEKTVAALDAEVKELKVSFSSMNREATRLKDDLEKTAQTLEVASSLLGKLSGEKKRWDEQSKSVGVSLEALPFNAMLAAAVINFLGASPEDVRQQTLNDWKSFCKLKEFDFMSFLATESQQLLWKKQGLPSDTLSMQNALIILNSVQCPYVIDPNGQAAAFLRKTLESKTLDSIMQQDPKFVTLLETAVRFGRTLIVSEADRVLPIVYPLLRRDLFKKGGRVFVQVGDKEYDYNDQFRLFMVTRNTDPDITADAAALITTVNFTVTRSGLEGQLLALTLEAERPELEKTKSKLLAEEDQYRVELADLEKSLLQELAMSEGNILENKALIASLDKTKSQSSHIGEMLRSAKQVAANLDVQRDVYRPIAKTGSLLFFLIAQLNAVNNMYEFSLPTFIRLFNDNLRVNARKDAKAPMSPTNAAHAADLSAKEPSAAEKKATDEHIQRVRESLKLAVLYYVSRSLFKADRLMFGLHMIHCLQPHLFQPKEWEFFTGELVVEDGGGAESKAAASAGGGLPAWATKDRAGAYASLASTFPALTQRLDLHDGSVWGAWAKNSRCEQEFPPAAMAKGGSGGQGGVTPFQRLLLVQTLRPDRLQSAIQLYVCETLGVKSLAPPQGFNLGKLVDETSPTEPILFVATAGADPSLELEEFAMKTMGKGAYVQIALGSGQTEGALIALRRCAEEGHWLCLKNLHLVTHWLGDFEKFFRALKPKPKFRLWLTTEPHPTFPSILLQQSLKVTYESPPGLKQNLLRTFESWDSAYFASGSTTRAQILFVLAWFHAIVQERRTYIPQGFTKFYEFSFADLRSGADIIDAVCARITDKATGKLATDRLPWPTLWGLMEQAIYGGRIDNDHDIRVVVTYLHKYFNLAVLPSAAAAASAKLHVGLELPISNKYDDYMKLIQSLPNTDSPGVFTLAPNVEGAVQQTQSSAVVSQLRKLAVSSQLSSKFDREAWRSKLSPLLNLWDKLAVKSDKGVLTRPPKSRYAEADMSPVDSFVTLENNRAFEVLTMVGEALHALHGVCYGSGLLTPQIRDDANALLAQTVPNRWAKAWGGSEDPATFLREVVARQLHLRRWLERVNTGATLSEALPLALVFSSRTFLNALRQQTARAVKKPIDTLKLTVAWNRALLPKSAAVAVDISGLLCQGVGFDARAGGLLPLTSDAPTLTLIPTASFAWIDKADPEPYPDGLALPLYFSPTREEFICEVRMPAKPPLDQWILSGAALFLADVK